METAHATALTLVKQPDPEYQGLAMSQAPAEAKRRMQELQAFIGEAMVINVDYGVIPGTKQPTLFNAGAGKLCELYGLAADFQIDEKIEEWDKGFFYYRFRVVLTDRRNGAFAGMGIGSCNSREKKYAGRWVPDADVPSYHDKKTLKRREGMEWLWSSKLPPGTDIKALPKQERQSKDGGKSYAVYGINTTLYFVPNEDVCDLVNTIQKMAAKRAFVMAVLQVTRSAGIFSQDLEDLPLEAIGQVEERRSWEREPEVLDADFTEAKPAGKAATAVAPAAAKQEAKGPPAPKWDALLAACTTKPEVNGVVAAMVKHYGQGATPVEWQQAAKKRGLELTPQKAADPAAATAAPAANVQADAKPQAAAPAVSATSPAASFVPCSVCGDRVAPSFLARHMETHPASAKPAAASVQAALAVDPPLCTGDHSEPQCLDPGCYLSPPPADEPGAEG